MVHRNLGFVYLDGSEGEEVDEFEWI